MRVSLSVLYLPLATAIVSMLCQPPLLVLCCLHQVHTHDSNPAAAPKAPVSGDARGAVELEGINSTADFTAAYDGLHAKIMAKSLGR